MKMNFTYLLATLVATSIFAGDIPNAPTKENFAKHTKENQAIMKLGEDIMNNTNTHPLSKKYVGNGLTCSNCHVDAGRKPSLGSFVGTATVFPTYTKREKTVQTLQDRILNCFTRSMNGTRPELDSKVAIAMTMYIAHLSEGLPMKLDSLNSGTNPFYAKTWHDGTIKFAKMAKKATNKDYLRGKKLYTQQCASCHQANGEGIPSTFPAVWGDQSYNIAAGLGQLNKLPTWLKANMPMGAENTLSDKDAFDIALYVDAQPRPSVDLHAKMAGYRDTVNASDEVKAKTGVDTVRSHFKAFGLDIDKIRGDKVIPAK